MTSVIRCEELILKLILSNGHIYIQDGNDYFAINFQNDFYLPKLIIGEQYCYTIPNKL